MSTQQGDTSSKVGVGRCALAVIAISFSSLGTIGCNADPMEDPGGADLELSVATQAIAYGGHDYLFVTTAKTWSQASAHCQQLGYTLASVSDANEESFLNTEQLHKAPYDTKWWLGLNDIGIEGSYYWTDSTPFTYSNWWPGQPDAKYSNEDCVVDGWGSQWNDWGCGNLAYFICEKQSTATGYTDSFFYNTGSTSNATINTAPWNVYAYQGQVVTVGTCGLDGASFSGDTFLRIRNTTGVEFAFNDDSCGAYGRGSNISFVAPTTGSYTLHAGCYQNNSCSGTVAIKVGP